MFQKMASKKGSFELELSRLKLTIPLKKYILIMIISPINIGLYELFQMMRVLAFC